jgi:hypothetical protein
LITAWRHTWVMERHADVVVVPHVVGLTVAVGQHVAAEAGLKLAQPDPDGPPLAALTWPDRLDWVITSQDPAPGTPAYKWDSVVVQLRDEEASGVREPRRPLPDPRALGAERDPG